MYLYSHIMCNYRITSVIELEGLLWNLWRAVFLLRFSTVNNSLFAAPKKKYPTLIDSKRVSQQESTA